MELIPSRASFGVDDDVEIELTASAAGTLRVTRLAETVAEVPVAENADRVRLGSMPLGGYGVELHSDGRVAAASAFDVLADPFERPRYGFVARMDAGAEPREVSRFFRRLHLDLAQFYDWGYRHSALLPPERLYRDPLGQPRDLAVVDALATALDATGSAPLGYSAVYAIGHDELTQWQDAVLLRGDGAPYRLGEDFLVIVDPAHPRWLAHYTAELARALAGTELRGFHLDQYGWPKAALRGDGVVVDLAASFRTMIEAVSEAVPDARLVFNNVNDFGTLQTASAPQDASYIEVWPPHDTLGDLGLLATRTRALRPEHPPILSAYLSCYAHEPAERADAAAQLVMATAFSHGATHLLLGETGSALIDPYYPRNHELAQHSVEGFVAWYDFLVRWGDLLLAPEAQDVTEFTTGGINGDIVLESPDEVVFSTKAVPGTVWTRVVRTHAGTLVHLIDLREQTDTVWDAGKQPPTELSGLSVRIAPVQGAPEAWWASPTARHGAAEPLSAASAEDSIAADSLTAGQTYVRFALPAFRTWGFVWFPAASPGQVEG